MADRIKLRRGPKSKIDLNVYELGYVTDSTEKRLYFNDGSMVPIPNEKDITDIRAELTEATNVSEQNKKDVLELKENVAGIIKTGVAKLVQYSYDIELRETTKKVNIPYEKYSSVTDTLKVYVNGLAIQNDQYTITDPVENEGVVTNGYIVLKVERPAGTIVRMEVWKNVPSGEEGEVNGNVIAQNSLPLDRIIGIGNITTQLNERAIKTYCNLSQIGVTDSNLAGKTQNEIADIIINAMPNNSALELYLSKTTTANIGILLPIRYDGVLRIYKDTVKGCRFSFIAQTNRIFECFYANWKSPTLSKWQELATQDDLIKYEEGTFTPKLKGTHSYSQQKGFYKRIGNLVHLDIVLAMQSVNDFDGDVIIEGLPFVSLGEYFYRATANIGYNSLIKQLDTDSFLAGFISEKSNAITLISNLKNNTGVKYLKSSDLNNFKGAMIMLTVDYIVGGN